MSVHDGCTSGQLLLTVRSGKAEYIAARLGFNDAELFYHFSYSKRALRIVWFENGRQRSGRLDHVSFHKDGSVHVQKNGHVGEPHFLGRFHDSSFLPKDSQAPTPLIVHSVRDINGLANLDSSSRSAWRSACILQTDSIVDFSVILVLSPSSVDVVEVCKTMWVTLLPRTPDEVIVYLDTLLLEGTSSVTSLPIWKEWTLHVLVTESLLPLPNLPRWPLHQHFVADNLSLPLRKMLPEQYQTSVRSGFLRLLDRRAGGVESHEGLPG